MQARYRQIKKINLEFARDVEDEHLILLRSKVLIKPIHCITVAWLKLSVNIILFTFWISCLRETSAFLCPTSLSHVFFLIILTFWECLFEYDIWMKLVWLLFGVLMARACKDDTACYSFNSSLCLDGWQGIESLQGLESLNLNGCQKISDRGIEAITNVCPNLRALSIYWNVRYISCFTSLLKKAFPKAF